MKNDTEQRRLKNNQEYEKYLNEKVPVCIPLGGERIGTSTTASCDGTVYEIKLGETVYVPRKVAEVIERSVQSNTEVQKKIDRVSSCVHQLGEY